MDLSINYQELFKSYHILLIPEEKTQFFIKLLSGFINKQDSDEYLYYICGNKGIGATTAILWTLRKNKHIRAFYFDYKMIISFSRNRPNLFIKVLSNNFN